MIHPISQIIMTEERPYTAGRPQSARPRPIVALIYTHNAEETIEHLIRNAQLYVDQVILADDGSDDRTVAIAKQIGVTVVQYPVPQGKGATVALALNYAHRLGPLGIIVLDAAQLACVYDLPHLRESVLSGAADTVACPPCRVLQAS
jgi:cellulose synthase/poly-beta-1,6-N-acetylglucosamine synthase-like glycosyltransferase